MSDTRAEELLTFWFGDLGGDTDYPTDRKKLWWSGGPEIDGEIRERFAGLVDAAVAGELDGWAESARGRLALIIACDQLTRSLGRGTAGAFRGDPKAQRLVLDGIERGHDRELRLIERSFFYMPLMHAEDAELAERCVSEFTDLAAAIEACDDDGHPNFLGSAVSHADIVKEFGRYPHRNEILEREATEAEEKYLAEGGATFGQKKK